MVLGCGSRLAGSSGVGDPYFPKLGNGGYDALDYHLALTIDPAAGTLTGDATMKAEATQDLESFNLDYAGPKIATVAVDGAPARFTHKGEELAIHPVKPLGAGQVFEARVVYSGIPEPLETVNGPQGWHHEGDTVYTLGEPEGAATWYPVNDHPSDKATYRIEITVPKPYVAVATGMLVETKARQEDQTFVWEMRQPLASYLAGISVGDYELEETPAREGLTIRNYFPPDLDAAARSVFAPTAEMLAFYEEMFGPYPFEAYGVVVPDATCYLGMENQTLSVIGRDVLELTADGDNRNVIVPHELAHQWFGNSVSLSNWEDIWLNEGFATYASWLWLEHKGGQEALLAEIQETSAWLNDNEQVPCGDPGADRLFSANVYGRGALTLHALRLKVGDGAFFDILREWNERHHLANATTADFIALAEEIGGVELSSFFDEWLHGEGRLPGIPARTGGST